MASKPVMLLGNLASIALAIAGILQAISWTIAGATILAILSITTLAPTRSPGSESSPGHSVKKTGHANAESNSIREKIQKQTARPHQTTIRPEQRPAPKDEPPRPSTQTRPEFQRTMTPKITPPKTVPTSSSPVKTFPGKPGLPKQEALTPVPVGVGAPDTAASRPSPPRIDPNTRVIERGDYTTYEIALSQRAEVTCEVTASAPVNVYIMDMDNLNSLDLGEEFWSETGEEGVQKATLHFVAPQSGKWVLVVENTDNLEASATANIRKSPPRAGTPTPA